MTQRTFAFVLVAAVLMLAVGCGPKEEAAGGDAATADTYGLFTQRAVGLAITVSNEPVRTGGFGSVAQRERLEITAATLNLEAVMFYLPATLDCEGYINIANETVILQPTTDAVTNPVTTATTLAPGSLRTNYTTDDNEPADNTGTLAGPERIAACVDNSLVFEGPFQVDLTDGTSVPPLRNLGIPAGSYSNIRLQISPGDRNAGALEGITLLASGGYSDSLTSFAVTMAVELDTEINIRPSSIIQVDPEGGERIRIIFDTSTWRKNLDLPDCYSDEVSGPAPLLIGELDDSVDCRRIHKKIEANIAESLAASEEEPAEVEPQ